ncbi:MAG: phosphoribosyl-ATP diphosphatase [Rhodoluna sp.]|jgi:phosphoribosyl-ATP pyrophosphohydrolase
MKTFEALFNEIQLKSLSAESDSNTKLLLDLGVHAIGKKIVEEAAEVWMAAEHETNDDLALEISQLIYHLQVLMVAKGLTLQDLEERY